MNGYDDEMVAPRAPTRGSEGLAVRSADGSSIERTAETSVAAAAERSRALVEARFALAMRRPRDVEDFRVKLLKECSRPGFAAVARYAKPIGGGKTVPGWSIRSAEAMLRLFGNLSIDSSIALDDAQKRILRVEATDLETLASLSIEVVIEKTVERSSGQGRDVVAVRTNSYGKKVFVVVATEDELLVKGESVRSKAIRNLILRMIPGDLLDEAREVVEETIDRADRQDPDATKRKLLDAFAKLGVKPSQLREYLGNDTDVIAPAQLSELRSVYAAISSGEATWADFSAAKADPKTGEVDPEADARKRSIIDRVRSKRPEAKQAAPAPEKATLEDELRASTGREPGED
jgi:hypothetical protein